MPNTKKIVIVDSCAEKNYLIADLLEVMSGDGFHFTLYTSKKALSPLTKLFAGHNWPMLDCSIPNKASSVIATALRPLLAIFWLGRLFNLRRQRQLDCILLHGMNEKLIITPAAKLLKIKTIWLELPGADYPNKGIAKKSFLNSAKWADVALFDSATKLKLEHLSLNAKSISLIRPAIKLHQQKFQENIFHKIAQAESQTKKFFNLGIIGPIDTDAQIKRLEFIFHSIKAASQVVSNLQLIVIGDGKEKKRVMWLAKKLEIESIVWLVGEQSHLKKWLESFDVYLAYPEHVKMNDFSLALRAMEAELPVIAPAGIGFEDLIEDGISGLITETLASEALANQIIRLKQDRHLEAKVCENAKKNVEYKYNLESIIPEFKQLFD